MKGFVITPLTKKDMTAFRHYIGKAFHRKYILRDARYLKWQYSRFYIIRAGGSIVGHFGFRDVAYKVHDTTKRVRVLMNLYVLAPYRIFGVGTMLIKKVFATAQPVFVSGYTQATGRLGKELRSGWNDAGVLERHLAILDDSASLLARYGSLKALSRLQRKTIRDPFVVNHSISVSSTADISFSELWRAVKSRYPVAVERTDAYMKWRFKKHPMLSYHFLLARRARTAAGYIVYRYEEDQGFKIARIIDFVAEKAAERSLLSEFIEKSRREGAHAADFLFSGAFYKDSLKYAGFFNTHKTSFANFPILFSPIAYEKTKINIGYDLPVSFSDCYFTKADGDQDRPNPQ